MSYIKNRILSMCEDYELGHTIQEISLFYSMSIEEVECILSRYSGAYLIENLESESVTKHS
jgi:metal-sulfur cluster biosynthetic enzyme